LLTTVPRQDPLTPRAVNGSFLCPDKTGRVRLSEHPCWATSSVFEQSGFDCDRRTMNPRSSSIGPEVRDVTTLAVPRISARVRVDNDRCAPHRRRPPQLESRRRPGLLGLGGVELTRKPALNEHPARETT